MAGCSSNPLEVDLSDTPEPLPTRRFDQAFFAAEPNNWKQAFPQLKKDFPPFFQMGNAEFWLRQRQDSIQNILKGLVDKHWKNPQPVLDELHNMLWHYNFYYPNRKPIASYTYISDLDYDYPVLYADSLLFIALDQFVGLEAPYFKNLPTYLAADKWFDLIPIWAAEAMAQSHVPPATGTTLLDAMVHEGRVLAWMRALLPNVPEHLLLKYTASEWDYCMANEAQMWRFLVENQLLFDPSDQAKQRYIQPAPFTKFGTAQDNQIPGQAGRWLGYQLVKSYLEAQDYKDPISLLQETNSQQVLRLSQYKPR